jgi:hypothetical protein
MFSETLSLSTLKMSPLYDFALLGNFLAACDLATLICLGSAARRISAASTAARWPNFRPNNSKGAPKKFPWPKKLEAVKLQNLDKSGRKEAGKCFYNYLELKPYNSLYFLRFFLRN